VRISFNRTKMNISYRLCRFWHFLTSLCITLMEVNSTGWKFCAGDFRSPKTVGKSHRSGKLYMLVQTFAEFPNLGQTGAAVPQIICENEFLGTSKKFLGDALHYNESKTAQGRDKSVDATFSFHARHNQKLSSN